MGVKREYMIKRLEGLFKGEGVTKKEVKKYLKKKHKSKVLCYVLITCTESDSKGKLDVCTDT